MIDLSKVDKSVFMNIPYIKRIEKPWGYELIFTPETLSYTGKILHITSGKRLSLQVHDKKQETQFLLRGECRLIIDNEKGELMSLQMETQKGYTIKAGQRHRLEAEIDCDVLEVSTPEVGTTYRLEDDYKRPDETEDLRRKERNGI